MNGSLVLVLLLALVALPAVAASTGGTSVDVRGPPAFSLETFLLGAGLTVAALAGAAGVVHLLLARRAAVEGVATADEREALEVAAREARRFVD